LRLHAERRCNCRHRQAQEQCLQQATGNTCHFLSPSHAAAYRDIPRPREEPVAPAQPVSVRTISGTSAASYERIIQASAARSALISNDLLNISASSYIAAGQTGPSKFTSPGCPVRPSDTGRPRTPVGEVARFGPVGGSRNHIARGPAGRAPRNRRPLLGVKPCRCGVRGSGRAGLDALSTSLAATVSAAAARQAKKKPGTGKGPGLRSQWMSGPSYRGRT
jgi:hypothetical protein